MGEDTGSTWPTDGAGAEPDPTETDAEATTDEEPAATDVGDVPDWAAPRHDPPKRPPLAVAFIPPPELPEPTARRRASRPPDPDEGTGRADSADEVRDDTARDDAPRVDTARDDEVRDDGARASRQVAEAGAGSAATGSPGTGEAGDEAPGESGDEGGGRRRRRRGGRGRSRSTAEDASEGADADPVDGSDERGPSEVGAAGQREDSATTEPAGESPGGTAEEGTSADGSTSSRRRRRRSRANGDDSSESESGTEGSLDSEIQGVKGSTRLEARRQRRRDNRGATRRAPVLSEAEFLSRRESVDRVMAVREREGRTQIAVLEDDVLVEHYVATSGTSSLAGSVFLGRVQNVLPSMEAAFIDIGRGRNAVLYAGEVNWEASGLDGKPRLIEHALSPGQLVPVQVTKEPIGSKGARLTSQVSLPGRFVVFVPDGSLTGISRKLPDAERARLREILGRVVPEDAGVIVRTAAEGASEDDLTRDIARLTAQWEAIQRQLAKATGPTLLYEEPDVLLRVVRDLFNEDFSRLVVQGRQAWEHVHSYVEHIAPELLDRVSRHDTGTEPDGDTPPAADASTSGAPAAGVDLFASLRVDEQIRKALERKVWLPSGGYLVIDRTEAMIVVDVNTGKFTGAGGNLEETVTRNNLEAAEEIVRQLRLRDAGGIIVIDFIDMVLSGNRDLVLRRLVECLGRDRTRHQVAEVTSLGLVQMTRKRVAAGLVEAFSETCDCCKGRGVILHDEPLVGRGGGNAGGSGGGPGNAGARNKGGGPNLVAAAGTATRSGKGRRTGAAGGAGKPAPDENGAASAPEESGAAAVPDEVGAASVPDESGAVTAPEGSGAASVPDADSDAAVPAGAPDAPPEPGRESSEPGSEGQAEVPAEEQAVVQAEGSDGSAAEGQAEGSAAAPSAGRRSRSGRGGRRRPAQATDGTGGAAS